MNREAFDQDIQDRVHTLVAQCIHYKKIGAQTLFLRRKSELRSLVIKHGNEIMYPVYKKHGYTPKR